MRSLDNTRGIHGGAGTCRARWATEISAGKDAVFFIANGSLYAII